MLRARGYKSIANIETKDRWQFNLISSPFLQSCTKNFQLLEMMRGIKVTHARHVNSTEMMQDLIKFSNKVIEPPRRKFFPPWPSHRTLLSTYTDIIKAPSVEALIIIIFICIKSEIAFLSLSLSFEEWTWRSIIVSFVSLWLFRLN